MTTELTKYEGVNTTLDESDMMLAMTRVMMAMMMVMVSMSLLPILQQSQAQAASQAYSGQEDPRRIHATNILSWINLVYDYPFVPWISAYIINDGPSSVEIGINFPDDKFTLKPEETRVINHTEQILVIFFKCFPGLKATVRVTEK